MQAIGNSLGLLQHDRSRGVGQGRRQGTSRRRKATTEATTASASRVPRYAAACSGVRVYQPEQPQRYDIVVQGIGGARLAQPAPVDVAPAQARWVTVAVRVPPDSAKALGKGAHALQFRITPAGDAQGAVNEKSTFVVPR